tara:strand:- start:310 stop:1371 length:1062 start_codon:yes stop_codon:yes gene_type:complete
MFFSFKVFFISKKFKYYRFSLLTLSLLISLIIINKNRTPLIRGSFATVKVARKYFNKNLYEDELLGTDFFTKGRSFASIIQSDNRYLIYYSSRNRFNNNITINMREANNLRDLSIAKSRVLINKFDANVTAQVWMPYVFKENNNYFMIFTARSGDYMTDNYLEEIRIANSKDGINWEVNPKPILSPSLQWEGREVENWGIIKKGKTYYMSYESRGYKRRQSDRAIGIAYSNNLRDWKRMKDEPFIFQSEYCSAFFSVEDYIYHLVPNNNRFRVYRFNNFGNFDKESFIGFWYPLGKENKYIYDSPDIITPDIRKKLNSNSPLKIIYSVYINDEWVTKFIKYENPSKFFESLIP